MNNTNTIHVTHISSGDLWAGAEVQLYTLCTTLSQTKDVTVNVILLNHGTLEQKLRQKDIPVVVLDEKELNGIQILYKIFQLLKKLNSEIVHTHRLKENIIGSSAAWLARIPSIRTIHGAPEHRPNWLKPHKRLFYFLDWLTARHLQSCSVLVSEELKEVFIDILPNENLKVIENGIDTEALVAYQKYKLEIDVNSSQSIPFKIGLAGRLVPVKRVDLFINAAKYFLEHHEEIPIQFHIFGDGPLRKELEELVLSLNLTKTVTFEGHCDDIHTQISLLDALIISSDHEGLPMNLLEAMSIGTPVVAHAVGGINKVCKQGECCWLYDDNNGENIANTILECLMKREERKYKANLAQNRIRKYYSTHINAYSYKAVYQEITHK